MTKEQKNKYQAFAVKCMKNGIPVTHRKASENGRYRVKAVIYSLKDLTKEDLFTVWLADLNGCDSMITVGLEEFYNENYKEEELK